MKSDKEIEEAMKKLDEIYADKELRDIITMKRYARWEYNLDMQEATEKGERRGETIGKDKANNKIIKNMLKRGMKIEDICEIVDINKQKVLELMNV